MEYFARSPEVIARWARHHITRERVPLPLLTDALSSRGDFGAIELQNQVFYSAADQFLFGNAIGDLRGDSPKQVYRKILTGLAAVQQEYTVLPLVHISESLLNDEEAKVGDKEVAVPAVNLLHHTHFVNYGAGYYSYLFAKMYAAQIWKKRFADKPLSRAAGELLWKNMLIYGSGKEPIEMLTDLAGGPLDPNHYLQTVLFAETEEL